MKRRDAMRLLTAATAGAASTLASCGSRSSPAPLPSLWAVYDAYLKQARYVDLSHTLTPYIPVWSGFDPSKIKFGQAVNADPTYTAIPVGSPFQWEVPVPGLDTKKYPFGFEATTFTLTTDQFGTQLDPPAHWNPFFPAIDELTAAMAVRPLVVISIADKVWNPDGTPSASYGYALTKADILAWEAKNGAIPAGSAVMVRSDWAKQRWPGPDDSLDTIKAKNKIILDESNAGKFPSVSVEAVQYLHEVRKILFHGHEPLDADPTLETEAWLLENGYPQAEGVANLDKVPETGALLSVGFPKFKGGTGGFVRFVAICPPDWREGVVPAVDEVGPTTKRDKRLVWDSTLGMRVRK